MPADQLPSDGLPGQPHGPSSPHAGDGSRRAGTDAARKHAIGGFRTGHRRNPRAVAIAVALHLVAAVLIARTYTFRSAVADWFGFSSPVEERLTFVATVPPADPEPDVAPAAPEEPSVAPSRQPTAPTAVPAGPPPLPLVPASPDTGRGRAPAAGAGVGVEPALVGIRPGNDARLWATPGGGDGLGEVDGIGANAAREGRPLNAAELDSFIRFALTQARDSLDSLAVLNAAPMVADWTFKDGNGGKWGLDERGLRLGKVTIPSFLLGLLSQSAQRSLGMMGNPAMMERNRSLSLARGDIARFRESGPGEQGFREQAKALAEQRERERRARRDALLDVQRAAATSRPRVTGTDRVIERPLPDDRSPRRSGRRPDR